MLTEVRSFWEVLAQKAVGIFITATLPWALRVTEVDVDSCLVFELFMLGHFGALIPS
ncbi:hypothetical protein DT23_14950 [Thioclava indica]|uniref:Uncharacterized protein n=1 Tax=Thioclava indica TaxID=1353528 RepID=A0A074JVU2_9RHOB|nr:hypothetical protein DT23_14950 [Thioclava indica]